MGSEDTIMLTELIKDNQRENRAQFSELRESTAEMAQAVTQLTTTIARVEERHAAHDDGLKRVGKQVDDHEKRIRSMEKDHVSTERAYLIEQDLKNTKEQVLIRGTKISTGWKTISIIGGGFVTFVGLLIAAVAALG